MTASRVCSTCQSTVLSRYNPDDICAACSRAPGEPQRMAPAWLWDSPPMREALARLDPGAALAIFRAASGLSQQDVADIMGWSQSAVSLIEKGQRDTLFDLRVLLRFADVMDMPRAALTPLLTGMPDATLGVDAFEGIDDQAGEDVNRRSFGGLAAGAAAAILAPEASVPGKVTAAHVRYLQACSDGLYRQELATGGAGVLKQAIRHWRHARRLLEEGTYADQTGRDLISATADLAVRAGWASYDSGDQNGTARQFYNEALLLADHAGDDPLAVRVLQSMALQSVRKAREGRPGCAREAIRLSERASQLARRDPTPRLHALIAAREAVAHSVLGDRRAFQSAISRAWRELDREPGTDGPVPAWLKFVGPAEVKTHEARGLVCLGDAQTATTLCQDSLQAPGLSPRNRAYYHAQLAATLAASGEAREAVSEGLSVLPVLEKDVGSLRTLRELSPVRSAAQQVGDEEFCVRFDHAVSAATPRAGKDHS